MNASCNGIYHKWPAYVVKIQARHPKSLYRDRCWDNIFVHAWRPRKYGINHRWVVVSAVFILEIWHTLSILSYWYSTKILDKAPCKSKGCEKHCTIAASAPPIDHMASELHSSPNLQWILGWSQIGHRMLALNIMSLQKNMNTRRYQFHQYLSYRFHSSFIPAWFISRFRLYYFKR